MKFNPNQRYTRWSIRRLSVGVASVVVASGFFVLVGQPSSVRADAVNPTPGQVLPEGTSVAKEGDLPETQGDTVLTEVKPEVVAGNTNSLSTSTEGTEVSEETSPSRLDTLFEKGEETQENPELTDVLKKAVDTADVDGTQASPEDIKKAVDEDVNDTIDVPAAYLEQAKASGPFLAGVNKPLKYELFAGDGMLTRLLLKASDKAPWSDNGVAQNEKIPPVKNLPDGKYYYQVSLNGNTEGKKDQDLLDTLRTNGTNTYEATLTVYEADGDKPDLTVKSFELLWILASNPERVFSKTDLYEKIWKEDYVDDTNTLNVHIHALRQELAKYSSDQTPTIKTVWGLGYKIEKPRGQT